MIAPKLLIKITEMKNVVLTVEYIRLIKAAFDVCI
jgi:hypothetical protein